MDCFCYETEDEFVLCIENVESQYEENLKAAWFTKTETGFIKPYPMKGKDNGVCAEDRARVASNFARLRPSMFEGVFDWESVLSMLAQKFLLSGIEWYIIGSVSEAVLGVPIAPHDLDIIVHTKDFFRVKKIFADAVVEPFVDNHGAWLVRYFGRLCVGGAIIDIAADEKMNAENRQPPYEKVFWNGFEVLIEPLWHRHQVEIGRGRVDRIRTIERYMGCT